METERDNAAPLIFEWNKPGHKGPGLFIWILATLLGIGFFFYLFKIGYPQTQRVTPVPQQVFMLNGALPANQALIHRVRDLDYLILSGSDDTIKEVKLEDRVPVFHPSFEKHELQVQDLPHKDFTTAPPRLLDATAPVLRAPDLSELKKMEQPLPGVASKAELRLHLEGPATVLKLMHQPDFNALSLSDPDAWRYQIGIEKSTGRVAFSLPINMGEPSKTGSEILKRLQELQFEPQADGTPAESVIWSLATFVWSSPP